ncbi:hypothetical protein PC116_g11545 [Phytophthora cactorum]|nr:hypothetical protein PC119_g6869 [Phytophthora cactorum]KAG4240501.1 hypothetical protein PC116_g11545 [Phytophthora cactorum]
MEESECRHELTIIEKKMVVRCYTFLDKYKKEDCFAGNRTRKLVELCIGVKKATVARVMQTYNENPEEVFQEKPSTRGRPCAYSVEEIAPTIKEFVETQNKQATPITTQQICNEVEKKHAVELEPRTMSRLLVELDYSYVVGEKRHIFRKSPENVAFRETYLAKKLPNRITFVGRRGKGIPRRPEA